MAAPDRTPVRPNGEKPPTPNSSSILRETHSLLKKHQEQQSNTDETVKLWVQYWLVTPVGFVYKAEVVFLFEIPVDRVPLNEARDYNEAQHHQVNACEDLIHQRWLVHTKGQKSWGQKVQGEKIHISAPITCPVMWVDVFVLPSLPTYHQSATLIIISFSFTLLLVCHPTLAAILVWHLFWLLCKVFNAMLTMATDCL